MRFLLPILLVCMALCPSSINCWSTDPIIDLTDASAVDAHFLAWKGKFNKVYESPEETLLRRSIFKKNLDRIQKHNAAKTSSFWMGANKFADLTVEEYRNLYLSKNVKHIDTSAAMAQFQQEVDTELSAPLNPKNPVALDWRNKNVVAEIKDQGQCGSCWTFSAVATMETANAIKTGLVVELSEQQILDCSDTPQYGNQGCDGGDMRMALQYVLDVGFIESEYLYPYQENQGTCMAAKNNRAASISGYFNVTTACDVCLENTVQNGTVSIGIDASQDSFQLYAGGVYDEPACSSTDLDHGVAIVGYDSSQDPPYWIVKNSWGTDWGDNGYIYMQKAATPSSSDPHYNMCGVSTEATLALM